jgi:hypothetical protein
MNDYFLNLCLRLKRLGRPAACTFRSLLWLAQIGGNQGQQALETFRQERYHPRQQQIVRPEAFRQERDWKNLIDRLRISHYHHRGTHGNFQMKII